MTERSKHILDETEKQMDITPYTKRDQTAVYLIFFIVLINFVILVVTLPWGDWF